MGALADGFAAYVQPLIDQTDGSMEQMNHAFAFGQLCYNLALLPDGSWEETLSKSREDFQMDEEDFEAFKQDVISPMIQRHHEMFPLMHGQILNDPWHGGRIELSSPAQRKIEIHPGTDRYAPCPCHSGKKYKFCCGK